MSIVELKDPLPPNLAKITGILRNKWSIEVDEQYLWEHTRSEDQYHSIIDAIRVIMDLPSTLVNWEWEE